MKFHMLLGFGGILAESVNVFFINPKSMAFFTLVTPILIYSLLYLSNIFSIKPLINDLILKQTSLLVANPGSPDFANLIVGVKADISLFFSLEWIFLLASAAISLFLAAATVLTSAVAYSRKNQLSLKELLLRTLKSLQRPLVTSFFTTLLGLGYICFLVLLLIPIAMLFINSMTACYAVSVMLTIPAVVFLDYLSVVWTMALVISVLEDSCGIEALGKAKELVKGMELHGFVLNLLLSVVTVIVHQGMRFVTTKESESTRVVIGLLVLNSLCLVKLFGLVAYTILYYQCKKSHGEEVELLRSIEYSKVATLPLINEDMAV